MNSDLHRLEQRSTEKEMTIGQFMDKVIAVKTKEEAAALVSAEVERLKIEYGKSAEYSYKTIMSNIGYYSGYYDKETAQRILELFNTQHPIFGKNVDISPQEAFEYGKRMGESFMEKE